MTGCRALLGLNSSLWSLDRRHRHQVKSRRLNSLPVSLYTPPKPLDWRFRPPNLQSVTCATVNKIVCCGVVLQPVCPCVVSFSKVHEHDTQDLFGHPREDPRRHVRHARFPEVIPIVSSTKRRHSRGDPREDVGEEVRVGVGRCSCPCRHRGMPA